MATDVTMRRIAQGFFAFAGIYGLLLSGPQPISAQTAATFPREWKGIATVTAMGVHNPHHPLHRTNTGQSQTPPSWNSYQEARTLQVLRQQGRHLELALISPRGNRAFLNGTLSADGRQLQVVDSIRSITLARQGNQLSGCGAVRGSDGTFDHYFKSYASVCWEFSATQ